uniref:Glycoside hydrolase family protein 28 n=1 Tax=Callosobruchus maculatus TaxID=64391 RepID=E7CIQ5_CALMS|nr:glycoside hydrolase family protein 28 [Callosobruchus maculatus]
MIAFIIYFAAILSAISASHIYDVNKFGADSTGRKPSTHAIQKAINKAASNNGGTVHFPHGQYLSGAIELKSNIILDFADDVVLKFLDDPKEYPPLHKKLPNGKIVNLQFTPLIRAFDHINITIRGNAVLDGHGETWWKRMPPPSTRPVFLQIFWVRYLTLENITVKSSPMFNVNLKNCDDVTIRGIKIRNPANYVDPGPNTDGINVNSCRRVHITGVNISTGDDCIALDANGKGKTKTPTEDVLIEDSHMYAGHGGVSIGSVTSGGLRNVTVRNCIFNGTNRGLFIKSRRGRGGLVEDIHYHNIQMVDLRKEGIAIAAIYNGSDPGLRSRDFYWEPVNETTPFIRNVEFKNIHGDSVLNPIFIVGLPESPIENVTFTNVKIESKLDVFTNNTKNVVINGKVLDS